MCNRELNAILSQPHVGCQRSDLQRFRLSGFSVSGSSDQTRDQHASCKKRNPVSEKPETRNPKLETTSFLASLLSECSSSTSQSSKVQPRRVRVKNPATSATSR